MRVVAGTARGRPLVAPPGRTTRPTSDRVREAVFNMLTSMDALEGAAVVDLFAGSGALGIEALSRGAASAVLVDVDRGALEAINANLGVLEEPGRARVVRADATRWVRGLDAGVVVDVVFADPPYAWEAWAPLLGLLVERTRWLVAETGAGLELGAGWEIARTRRYGTTLVTVARSAPAGPMLLDSTGTGRAEDPDLQPHQLESANPEPGGEV